MRDNNEEINKIQLIHGTSESKFEDIKNINIDKINNLSAIYSTNKFFSDGLSIEWLDTIVYFTSPSASSLSAIPQLVGRILRDYEGKEYVNVIDIYNDQFDIEKIRKKKREESYKNFDYNVLSMLPSGIDNTDKYISLVLNTSHDLSNPLDLL